jgi:hypothetical protein
MTYLNDRSRIELALPARLLRRCWAGIIEGHNTHGADVKASHRQLLEDLGMCCEEALAGLSQRDAEKLRARLDRAATFALLPYEADALMKTTLMVMYWIRDRLEAGDLTLAEGSLFESCFDRLHEGLADHRELWEDVNKSAAKQARKLHDRIVGQGYFRPMAGAVAA